MKRTYWMSLLLGAATALVAGRVPAQMNPSQSRNAPTEIEQLQQAFRYFQEEGARTRAALEAAQAQRALLEQELATLRQAADGRRTEAIATTAGRERELQMQTQAAERQAQRLTQENAGLRQQLADAESRRALLDQELAAVQRAADGVRAEAAATTAGREQELQALVQAAERQAQRLTQENTGLRQQLAETAARLTDLEVAVAQMPSPDDFLPPAPVADLLPDAPMMPATPTAPEGALEFVWDTEEADLLLPPLEPAEDIPSATVPETVAVEMELEEIMTAVDTTGEFEIEDLTEMVVALTPPSEPPMIVEPILPEDEAPIRPSIEERLTQGTRALRQGDLTSARQAFDSVLAEQPAQLTALLGLATCEYATDNFDAADELLSIALMRVPNHGEALGLRAIIRWRQGRAENAQNLLRRALTADSSNAQIFNYQGIIAHGQNDLPAAAEAFRRAITLDPDHIEAHFNLAVISVMLNPPRKEEARSYYEKAVSLGGEKNEALEKLIY